MTDTFENEDDMLAAEYALGLLTGEELEAAQRRVSNDPAFARLVHEWEGSLAAWADGLAPVAPSPAVKRAVMTDLFPEAPATQGAGLWSWFWPIVAVVSLASLAFVFVADFSELPSQPGPLYSAEIASEEGDFRVVALVDKTTNEVILTRTEGAAPSGRILQVWAHGEGEPAISVGLWPEGESVRLPMPPTIAEVEGILTLGVSEEPPGGSPTGSPSGRVFGTVDIPGVRDAL